MLYPYLHNPERNHSHAEWHVSPYSQKCDSCGKYHHVYFYQESWFGTLDGGDSLDYTECLHCIIKQKINSVLRKIKKFIIVRAKAYKIALTVPKARRSELYKVALRVLSK